MQLQHPTTHSCRYHILAWGGFLGVALLCYASCLADDPANDNIAKEQAKPLDRQEVEFFEKKIRPVLVAQCYKCHSSESKEVKGGLLLDSSAGILAGGESGPAIVSGDPKKSILIQALRHDGLEMPPNKKLPAETVADFERWISRGAVDPRIAAKTPASEKKEIDWTEARKYWSFRPITQPIAPSVKDQTWPRGDLDRFVLAKLESQQLQPVMDADRLTLLRRLTFDLTGLPPTLEEIDAFLADKNSNALEKVVDRLLASPRFGEHWGRHWLDVARYAESNGNVDNFLFPHAWRYRDYVIASLNADKPLDRFITEQVAGDLLPAANPLERNELVTATGFLALTSKPRPQNNPEYALDLVAEQIEVTTTAFMGLTVACARCHDHKFDPIPQREYYSLAAIFESTRMLHGDGGNKNAAKNGVKTGLHALANSASTAAIDTEQLTSLRNQQAEIRRQLEALIVKSRNEMRAKYANPADKSKLKNKLAELNLPLEKLLQKAEALFEGEQKEQLTSLKKQWTTIEQKIAELDNKPAATSGEFAMGLADANKPVEGKVRIRGESQKLGESVPRGFVTIGSLGKAPPVSQTQSGRLELAQWITSPDNTLTARVMANRVWRHLFGRGIVPSVDNFGMLGELPSHPELLDHLATQLVRDEWSLKKLIRSIVLSRTYQLSSAYDDKAVEVDPDNTLLWRHSVRRLEGESIRDAMLAVSGKLNLTRPIGSPVSKSGNIEVKNGNDREFSKYQHTHRSIYLPMVRNAEPEMLVTFDLPDTELVVGDRSITTVPAQSLFLLNSPWVIEQAQALAERVLALPGLEDDARLERVFRIAMGRDALAADLARLKSYLKSESPGNGSPDKKAWSRLCQTIFAAAEFRYIE
jgi:hypothetical protein